MKTGTLRHYCELQSPVEAADSYGQRVQSWVTTTYVWCAIEPLSGREGMAAQEVQATVTHLIRTHYQSGITSKMRLKLGDRVFSIAAVINVDERNRELHLPCTEAM